MNRFIDTVTASVGAALHRTARDRTREALLRQSDRTLADAGFSRELLLAGVRAWPWRVDHATEDARDAARFDARRRAAPPPGTAAARAPVELAAARADAPRVAARAADGGDRRDDRIAA